MAQPSFPSTIRAPAAHRSLRDALVSPGSPLRYAAAGLVNTGFGYAGILAAQALGAAPLLANGLGFALGFLVSLVLAKRWTFGAGPAAGGTTARYLACFLACYGGNLCVVAAGLAVGLPSWFAQGAGVGAYAVSFYLAARLFVFGQQAELTSDLRALMAALRRRAA